MLFYFLKTTMRAIRGHRDCLMQDGCRFDSATCY
nr:MAG TPA: hypothetical protein [Caudoviricetes sp.]DAQ50297.1 MAG TPA: hypothetical protein [Caudoviricetes sp.]